MEMIEFAGLPAALRRDWIESCRLRLPYETCGVVYGHYADHALSVNDFAILRNAAAVPTHAFSFDPAEWIRTWYDAERQGRTIVGIFHSHPNGTASPSRTDLEQRLNWGTYWLIGLGGQDAELAGFHYASPEGWQPLAIHIL